MSEDKKNNNDLINEEEIKRVEEMLNSSKKDRKKMLKDKNYSPKAEEKSKKEAKELKKKQDKEDIKSGKKKGLGEKLINIYIAVIAIALVILAVIYFYPRITMPSTKMTINELRNAHTATEIYQNHLATYNLAIPTNLELLNVAVGSDTNNVVSIKPIQSGLSFSEKYQLEHTAYYTATVESSSITYPIALILSTRECDDEITAFRLMIGFNANQDGFASFATTYIASFIQAYFGVDSTTAINMANTTLMAAANGNFNFVEYEDMSYRVEINQQGQINYFSFDLVPTSSLDTEAN